MVEKTHFWAQFKEFNKELFRFDTRIYLEPILKPSFTDDICIGAIIGKNPGSAKPSSNKSTLQPIELNDDKLLPTVKNIIIDAYKDAGIILTKNKYIQVLNLFYLCNNSLDNAIKKIKKFLPNHPKCPSEDNFFDFILYAWGGPNNKLDHFKDRFINNSRTNNHIWLGYKPYENRPSKVDFVKHIQGLPYKLLVPNISNIIKNEI